VLAHAEHEGELHLVLRNPDDQGQVEVAATSTRSLLGFSVSEPPAAAPRSRGSITHIVHIAKPAEPGTVRIIRSAQVTEQSAVTDSQ
jgi:hypothetical protein